jgi:CheY-like chemotaxis protein
MSKNKLRLFIIDDDEVNNFILVRLIKEKQIPVTCDAALNGLKGLKKLLQWHEQGSNNYPDIILLDIDMPVLDGFEFLDRYQEELYPLHRNVHLYMVSSSIRAVDRARAKSYESVSNFISKPLKIEVLDEIIKQFMLTRSL